MTKRRLAVLGSVAIWLITAGYFAAPQVLGQATAVLRSDRVVTVAAPPSNSQPITLRQAWQLAQVEGYRWENSAQIVALRSEDAAFGVGQESSSAGLDGRRTAWQANVVAPGKQLTLHIVNRTVVRAIEEPTNVEGGLTEPAIDSPAAVAIAIGRHLNAQAEKGTGYGFSLQATDGHSPELSVLGSQAGNPARVELDPASGAVLGASVYGFRSGGVLYSADAGTTWQATNLTGGQVTGIAPVAGHPRTAYAVLPSTQAIHVYQTIDGGRSWTQIGRLPPSAGPWAFGIAALTQPGDKVVLAVGSSSGLWSSTDNGASWAQSSTLPVGPPQWVSVSQASGRAALVVAITAGTDTGVYATTDMQNWRKLIDGPHRLSTMDGGLTVAALSDDQSKPGHEIRGLRTGPIEVSVPALRLVRGSARSMLVNSPTDIQRSEDGGRSWTSTLHAHITSLAAAPPTGGSDTALAAELGRGILHSADGGRSWQRVLSDPESLVPGSGRITGITFVSDSDVVAVNGGIGSWEQQ